MNDLAAQGLATRSPDGQDRRRNIIAITAAGTARLSELDKVAADVQHTLFALAPADRSELLRLLRCLVNPPM